MSGNVGQEGKGGTMVSRRREARRKNGERSAPPSNKNTTMRKSSLVDVE